MSTKQLRSERSSGRLVFLLFTTLSLCLAACEKESTPGISDQEEGYIEELRNYFAKASGESNLLISALRNPSTGYYDLLFENGDHLRIAERLIDRIEAEPEAWSVRLYFRNGIEIEGDLLGNSFHLEKAVVQPDPFGSSPLSALIRVQTPVAGKMRIRVAGQDGPGSDVVHTFDFLGADHRLEVLGLYAGLENTVEVTFLDPAGRKRLTGALRIQTAPLPAGIPLTKVVSPRSEVNSNLVYYLNYHPSNIPFMVDQFGKVRWYSTGFSQVQKRGFQRLRNGHLFFGADDGSGKMVEYTMLGEKLSEWSIGPDYEDIHHDAIELPNGNFIVTVDKKGASTIEDYLLEIDRASSRILTVWDLNEVMPKRRTLVADPRDWLHVNGVIYDERDHSLIVSAQRQGVFKVTWDNRLRWILAPPGGWGDYERYRLQPIQGEGEWCWGQHAPALLPNGHLFLFDNGFGRGYGSAPQFSRAAEFAIAEAGVGGTADLVWEYGSSRGKALFAPIVGDVDYLNDRGDRLITVGSLTYDMVYTDSTKVALIPSGRAEKGRLIEIGSDKTILFELLVQSEDLTGVVYRAEKMELYPAAMQ